MVPHNIASASRWDGSWGSPKKPPHLSLRPWSRACRGVDPGFFVLSILLIYIKLLIPKFLSWQHLNKGKRPVMQPLNGTETSPAEEISAARELQFHLPSLGIKASHHLVSCHKKSWILPHGSGQSWCWTAWQQKVEGEFRQRRILQGRIDARNSWECYRNQHFPFLLLPNQPT